MVAQTIDYASWVANLSDSDVVDIYLNFAQTYQREQLTLDDAFLAKFRTPLSDMQIGEPYGHLERGGDDETAEYLVPVRWLYSVPKEKAFSEVGVCSEIRIRFANRQRPNGATP